MRRTLILSLSALLALASCSSDEPSTPAPKDGGADADAAAAPVLDPKKGSFAPARTLVDAYVAQGRNDEIADPNRFFPMRDPLFVASALSEVLRAKVTTNCVNGAFGCPSPASANLLLAEYGSNEASLVAALKKTQAATHAWGRIALAENLLSLLNLLEQAKALDTGELSELVLAANKLSSALTAPTFSKAGVYPELGPNAALYKFAFGQIRPALGPSSAHLAAANDFIGTVFAKLTKTPNDKKVAGGELLKRFADGIIVQGIIVQGIIVQGSEAAQVVGALPYFITVGDAPDPTAIDRFTVALDAVVTKVAANTVTDPDWAKYATALDEMAATFDGPAAALSSSAFVPVATVAPKPVADVITDDPNVFQRKPTSELLRAKPDGLAPTVRLVTSGVIPAALGERRAPAVLPAGVEVGLPSRAVPAIPPPVGLVSSPKDPPIYAFWDASRSSDGFDHFDLRVTNLSTGKIVFHKVYRTDLDGTIATATILPADKSWFVPGADQELEVDIAAIDRGGQPSGISCGSLWTKVDTAVAWSAGPSTGNCFARAIDLGEAPLGDVPIDGVVIGNYAGTSYRPTLYFGDAVKFYNETSVPRRLQSLFTPDYSEIPTGVDLALRKDSMNPAGLGPLDTGVIPAHGTVTLTLPTATPEKYRFTLFDPDHGPQYKVTLVKGSKYSKLEW